MDFAIAAGLLITFDTVTGVWSTIVTGHKITSAKFSRVLTKCIGYGSVVIVCSVATHTIPGAEGFQPVAVSSV